MKVLRGLLGFLIWAFALVAGVYAAYVAFTGHVPWNAMDYLLHERGLALAAGVFVIGLAVLWPLSLLCPAGRTRYLSFENPGGEVRISLEAIRDFLARLAGEFSVVVSLRPRVCVRGGRLQIDMDCRIRAGALIPEFSQLLQERVRQSIQSSLGLSDVESVKVTVREIVGSAAPGEPIVRPPRMDEDHDAYEPSGEDGSARS